MLIQKLYLYKEDSLCGFCVRIGKKALRKTLCKKESKQIRKQITNMVFRLENGGIHLPVSTALSMLYDGMRTAGVNNGIRHRAH